MIAVLRALLRLILTVAWLAIGFGFGIYAGGKAGQLWLLPGQPGNLPHRGHPGLAVLGCALCGGLLCASVAAVSGFYVLAWLTLPPPSSDEGRLRAKIEELGIDYLEIDRTPDTPHKPLQ